MKSYVFVGPHPDTLNPGGTPLALDQVVAKVDLSDPHNRRLVEEGWLIEQTPVDRKAAAEARKAEAEAERLREAEEAEAAKAAEAASQNPDPDPEA